MYTYPCFTFRYKNIRRGIVTGCEVNLTMLPISQWRGGKQTNKTKQPSQNSTYMHHSEDEKFTWNYFPALGKC